jgi:hypothetical protein
LDGVGNGLQAVAILMYRHSVFGISHVAYLALRGDAGKVKATGKTFSDTEWVHIFSLDAAGKIDSCSPHRVEPK